jgi:hypothetical protein
MFKHALSLTSASRQNMLVLLMLYPVVFLFGYFVQNPLLIGRAALPFAVALFIGNVMSVVLLNYCEDRRVVGAQPTSDFGALRAFVSSSRVARAVR